jgi:glycosyltransferase involved in cell wall biosynthesis
MKHVLIIHYHFLPVHNVAVKQLVGYAKHLPALGWQALVLTRDWRGVHEADPSWGLSWEPHLEAESRCRIHRVATDPVVRMGAPARAGLWTSPIGQPAERRGLRSHAEKLVAKAARMGDMIFGDYPDEFVGWVRPAVAAGERLARGNRIDLIMSYCPPETNHIVARRLARRLGVPWVPFFGDMYGFLESPLPALSVEGWAKRAWHRWCIAPAAACAAVSPAMVDYLSRTYGKPSHLFHTGFDPEEFEGPDAHTGAASERMIISHVGSVYPDDQRPEILLDGLDRLLMRNPEIGERLEVRFVGSKCDDCLHAMLERRDASRVCTIQPKVDSKTAVSLVRSSDGLLAFTCTAHRDRYGTLSYPTKIFEAFGARRPVLAVPADDDWVDALLARTGGGTSARDANEVAGTLLDWFRSWNRDGRVPYHGRAVELAEFTQQRQAERLAALFDFVSG